MTDSHSRGAKIPKRSPKLPNIDRQVQALSIANEFAAQFDHLELEMTLRYPDRSARNYSADANEATANFKLRQSHWLNHDQLLEIIAFVEKIGGRVALHEGTLWIWPEKD